MSIWATAADHHGFFTLAEWRAFDATEAQLRTELAHGTVARFATGLYRVTGAPLTWEARVHGAVLAAGVGAAAGHRSAAALWALPGFPPVPVEVTRPYGRSRRRLLSTVRESLALPSTDVRSVAGIPVTTPIRTLLDLAGIVHPLRLDRLVDAALCRRLVDLEELRGRAREHSARGRAGTVSMRAALLRRQDGYVALESELEAELFDLLERAGLPWPTRQRSVGGTRAPVGRVDFVYRAARLVVEADSRTHHSALADWEADRERDLRLTAAGWRVVRITWWQVKNQPGLVRDALRAALADSTTLSVA